MDAPDELEGADGMFMRPAKSKLAILRSLALRKMTVSEVSRSLPLDKAAAHRHLGDLVKAGLVERRHFGRKWVYYELNDAGRAVLSRRARLP